MRVSTWWAALCLSVMLHLIVLVLAEQILWVSAAPDERNIEVELMDITPDQSLKEFQSTLEEQGNKERNSPVPNQQREEEGFGAPLLVNGPQETSVEQFTRVSPEVWEPNGRLDGKATGKVNGEVDGKGNGSGNGKAAGTDGAGTGSQNRVPDQLPYVIYSPQPGVPG